MRIMVIGGSGFLGSALISTLVSNGFSVANVSRSGQYDNKAVRNYALNIYDEKELRSVFKEEKPDIVINESGIVYWEEKGKDPVKDVETTVVGTLNLLENCVELRLKKFIFGSSISVYGCPPNKSCTKEEDEIRLTYVPDEVFSYALTKYVAEQYIQWYHRKYGLNHTILRYAHVYGPGQIKQKDVISIFIDGLINNKPLTVIGEGKQVRDYVYIEDVVHATILAMERGDNKIINIGGGKPISVNDLVLTLRKVSGKEVEVKRVKPGQVSGGVYMDISRAKEELDWAPETDLGEGLSKTIQYFRGLV